jgi:HlyD family secretion protein
VEGEYVYVAAPLGGRLERLHAVKGREVQAGEPLFALEATREGAAVAEARQRLRQARARLADLAKGARPTELAAIAARLDQAKAELRLAEVEYRRRRRLKEAGAVADEALDNARTRWEQARDAVRRIEAELATAELGGRSDVVRAARAEVGALRDKLDQALWSLAQKSQEAPAAARVFDTLYEPGEWVPAGRPVVSLLPPGNALVRFFVPVDELGRVRKGMDAAVRVEETNATLAATVTYVSPQVEYTPPIIYSSRTRAKLVVMVEAAPARGAAMLHPGMPVQVTLPASNATARPARSNATAEETP